MEGPCAGDSSKVIWSACRQFWGPSKINHCCVHFHRDTKMIDPYAFGGDTFAIAVRGFEKNVARSLLRLLGTVLLMFSFGFSFI